jgi:hypothetical protein
VKAICDYVHAVADALANRATRPGPTTASGPQFPLEDFMKQPPRPTLMRAAVPSGFLVAAATTMAVCPRGKDVVSLRVATVPPEMAEKRPSEPVDGFDILAP